jgi:hypothetical protein
MAPFLKYSLFHETTLNQLKPEWVEDDSWVVDELNKAITVSAVRVHKYALHEIPQLPLVDESVKQDLVDVYQVWRLTKPTLTTEDQQYFWSLDRPTRAFINTLVPSEYTNAICSGCRMNLDDVEFIDQVKAIALMSHTTGEYNKVLLDMKSALSDLARAMARDKRNDTLTNEYQMMYSQIQHLTKQAAYA